jgi:uncharacterized protein
MRFAQDSTSGINVIRAYGNGELRVNENVYRGAVILSAATVIADANIQNLDDLVAWGFPRTLALEPLHMGLSYYAPALGLRSWIRAPRAARSTFW